MPGAGPWTPAPVPVSCCADAVGVARLSSVAATMTAHKRRTPGPSATLRNVHLPAALAGMEPRRYDNCPRRVKNADHECAGPGWFVGGECPGALKSDTMLTRRYSSSSSQPQSIRLSAGCPRGWRRQFGAATTPMTEILECLTKHGQRLDSEIAEEIGLPLAKVRERLARLAATGE